MNLDFSSMTWTCMICKADRPDAQISVAYRPLAGMEDMFPEARANVRFCNDNPDCIAEANAPGPWPKEA